MSDFDCCRYCPPEKRYPGCGGSCPDYKEAKAAHDAKNQAQREAKIKERAVCYVQYNSMRLAKQDNVRRQKQGRK